jgi:outer membrane protein assembly factor BamB
MKSAAHRPSARDDERHPARLPQAMGLLAALAAPWAGAAENSGGYRGPRRDGAFPATGLMKSWPEGGPKLLWEGKVDAGWTAASVADGRVFFCGLDGNGPDGAMTALDLEGKALWRRVYGPDSYKPRGTPCVCEGVLYHHSTVGALYALDAATGKVIWSFDANALGDTLHRCGGNSASPLVCGDVVVITLRSPGNEVPGGNDVPSFVAVDRKTGKLAWKGNLGPCPVKGKGWSSFHASPIPLQAGRTPLVVSQFYRCAAAVRADTGERHWMEENGSKRQKRGTVQPVAGEGYLFVFGTRMLKVAADGSFKELWEGKVHVPEYNISYSNTVIQDGRLIAFTQDRAVNPASPGGLVMLDAETGEQLAALPSGAKGVLLWADGMIYLLDNRPRMTLIEPTKDALREVSSFAPPLPKYGTGDAVQLFTPPVVAEGRLFLRDQSRVLVYDIRAR